MPYGVTGGREPFLDRQKQGRPVGQRELLEHGAGAEGCLSHQQGPMGITECACHDLGGARRAHVNEDDEGQARQQASRFYGHGGRRARGISLEHYIALCQELARHPYGLVEQPSGVVSEVKDEAMKLLAL